MYRKRSVPYYSVILILSIHLLINSHHSSASSHWVVTEEGKIQAQVDSIFSMKRPYDLVSFMQQEQRAEVLNQLKDEMASKRFDETVDHVVEQTTAFDQNEIEMQKRFFETNSNCRKAKVPLSEFDLYVSTTIQPSDNGIDDILKQNALTKKEDEADDDDYDYEDDDEKPYCSNLDSSTEVATFLNKLTIVLNRQKLKMPPEDGMAVSLSLNTSAKLARYSKAIRNYLNKGKRNWLANFYASNYWRVVGNVPEAVLCLRNAAAFAPESSRHLALLGLANVCHRTHHSDEAISILHKAILLAPEHATLHFTLGNVYATVMQFNNSADSYQRAIDIRPKYLAAKARRYAVLCHENLERMLQTQHNSLQETLEELRLYKKQHDTWATVLSKILNEQTSLETRQEIQRAYDRMRQILSNKSDILIEHSNKMSKSQVNREAEKKQIVDRLLKIFEKKMEMSENFDRTEEEELLSLGLKEKDELLVPTLRSKYEDWPLKKVKLEIADPSSEECSTVLSKTPKLDDFPTVFVSPENRGFDLSEMYSVYVDIPLDYPAALPWFPPLCKAYNRPIPKYDRLKSFEKIRRLEIEVRSTAEKDIEIEYSTHSPVQSFHEWGARINAALKKITPIPEWVTYLLAGTYWRIWGHPQNGLECYKNALAKAPPKYLDIVLTNLAGLLYKSGSVGDAITLLQDAVQLNDKEPGTNFFLANMLTVKGNATGAVYHYKQVLRMDPTHAGALDLIQIPTCQAKFNVPAKPNPVQDEACAKEMSAECLNKNSLTKVPGMEAMIYCKDGQCKFVNPNDVVVNQNEEEDNSSINQITSEYSDTPKKNSKKKKTKIAGKRSNPPPNEMDSMSFMEGLSGEPTTTTLLMARDEMKHGLPQGAVEIGTIAETEPDEEEVDEDAASDSDSNPELVDKDVIFGPIFLEDDPLPDVLVSVKPDPSQVSGLVNLETCDDDSKQVNWQAFTSTWLSVSAKGIDIREFLGDYLEPLQGSTRLKPYCDPEVPNSLLTFDHLTGVRMRDKLHLASEAGLKEAFLGLIGVGGDQQQSMDETATRITLALRSNSTSWVLSTAAALYWRVRGNSEQAVKCLRHSLYYSPREMKDIPLISLANVLHRAGLYNDSLIVANMALEISPKFVVVHFTIANIYASMGDYDMAATFYLSTVTLQSTFDPARDRLMSLYCSKKSTIQLNVGGGQTSKEEL